jgi:6-phosphofructokinase 1
MIEQSDLIVPILGEPTVPSPMQLSTERGDGIADYIPDDARIVLDPVEHLCLTPSHPGGPKGLSFELAGPRRHNYFRGDEVAAGIVTCGGLCPGMNNVIRALVLHLWHTYGVRRIIGFRYGFLGLTPDQPSPHRVMSPEDVRDIHLLGGTLLGSSRGSQRPEVMVDTLHKLGINVLFTIGGDGTMRGTEAIFREICRREARIAVIGVPKTIDNDLPLNERTFGFDTAVSIATEAIKAAHVEATGAPNGVGLVRLMGRHSGFIAASAALASRDVNLVLVPELPFALNGEHGVLALIRRRLRNRGHCVVVVAEGAGQEHLPDTGKRDASGNKKLGDIGVFLRDTISRELHDVDLTLKYIDPSYIIRAAPANSADAIFCGRLAEDAVHAAMAGKTGTMIGSWLNQVTHVPLAAVTGERKVISLDSSFWRNVVEATGQPRVLGVPRQEEAGDD